jgi:hypothetical protein
VFSIYFKRKVFVQRMIAAPFGLAFGIWSVLGEDWPMKLRFVGVALALAGIYGFFASWLRLNNMVPALTYGPNGLEAASSLGEARFQWRFLLNIEAMVLQHHSLFGLMKQDLGRYIQISGMAEDGVERRIKLQQKELDLSEAEYELLFLQLMQAWQSQGASVGAAQAMGPDRAKGMRAAPIRRPDPAHAVTARGGFGRKGL